MSSLNDNDIYSSLKIWSLDDARVVRSIDHTEGRITCMAFRADSQYLITGGEDCSCKLWELSSGKLTQVGDRCAKNVVPVANDRFRHRFWWNMNSRSPLWSSVRMANMSSRVTKMVSLLYGHSKMVRGVVTNDPSAHGYYLMARVDHIEFSCRCCCT